MPNTITSKNPISALRAADVFGADQASNSNITAKVSAEQNRAYGAVGYEALLPTFYKKMGAVKAGTGNCRMLILGDSTTLGKLASSTQTLCQANNYSAVAQRMFNKAGITAQRDFIAGNGDGTSNTYDTRVTFGNSWASGGNTLGGVNFTGSTTSNALVFKFTGIVDTFKITYLVVSGAGTFSANIDGGSNTNTATAGASALASITLTASAPGIHTVNISYVSGGNVRIQGIEAWNSKISQLQIMSTGWGGATAENISDSTQPYSPLGGIGFCAPDLTVINIGINDWIAGTNTTTFSNAIDSLITEAKISGDCVIMMPFPSNPLQVTAATQDIYANILRARAINANVPVIDVYDRLQPYSLYTSIYGDNLHPNGAGYAVGADALVQFLRAAGAGSFTPMVGIPLIIQTVANNTYTYVGQMGCNYTILGIYEEARALTTAGTFAITINGTNITGLSAVVPTTAGSYTAATALNTGVRGDKIQIVYTSTSLVLDHTLTLDIVQTL